MYFKNYICEQIYKLKKTLNVQEVEIPVYT